MRDFRSNRIDERNVPESRHALFFRGLDSNQTETEIREFFENKIGPCRVVFYKQSRDSVCAAVRFEERSDAKKCLKSFENKKVMDSKVEISWFRDVRMYAERMAATRKKYDNHVPRRGSYHSRTSPRFRQRSTERAVSISSEESSPKRRKRSEESSLSKNTRRSKRSRSRSKRSRSNSKRSRSGSSYSSSSSSSIGHRDLNRRGPHTPPQTPPLETEEFSTSVALPEFIKVEIVGEGKNVGLICLNRPSESNALSAPMMDEVVEHLTKFELDRSIGAIVLTGSENVFSVGVDVKEMIPMDLTSVFGGGILENLNHVAKVKKPIIAAVNGFALGGGCELAMGCDIIYASENAGFGQPEILMGTIPGNGGTQRLTRVVGKSLAMELCLTGDHISAEEALKRGLISKIFPAEQLLDETVKLAEKIANNSPLINLMAKESVNRAFETTLQEGLLYERRMFHTTFATNDRKEGMSALSEKRSPKWTSS
jgi:enoyl-CoA hydratase